MLYIDSHGGIHYENMQCCASTQQVDEEGTRYDHYSFEFKGNEGTFHDKVIEFMTPIDFFKMVMEHIEAEGKQTIEILEMAQKMFEEEEKWNNKKSEAEEKTGIHLL